MIYLSDLSPLMQRAIALGITFMISKSGGAEGYYNLHFAKYISTNRAIRLNYNQNENLIYQCADENHAYSEFIDINDVLDYVVKELEL